MVKNHMKILCGIAVLAFILCVPLFVNAGAADDVQEVNNNPVSVNIDYDMISKVLSANRVFDEMLDDDLTVIEEATIVLLDHAEGEFISSGLVSSFITNLYGKEIDLSVAIYDGMPADEGYIKIVPRCYNLLDHHNIKAEPLPDGTVQVDSIMRVTLIDDEYHEVPVRTVLLPVAASSFGYNIISANILF